MDLTVVCVISHIWNRTYEIYGVMERYVDFTNSRGIENFGFMCSMIGRRVIANVEYGSFSRLFL